jgi:hypothetical protein
VTGEEKVGGLVGRLEGNVDESFASGNVGQAASFDAGGLVGYNSGNISDSYATGSVAGTNNLGGLVGNNVSSITNSYSAGVVTDVAIAGGLVGVNSGTVTNSYYNTNVTPQNDTGKGDPTAQMNMLEQLTFNGWDFTGIWEITLPPAPSYPHHQWYTGPEPTP